MNEGSNHFWKYSFRTFIANGNTRKFTLKCFEGINKSSVSRTAQSPMGKLLHAIAVKKSRHTKIREIIFS